MKSEPRPGRFTGDVDATIHVPRGHDHVAHAIRNIGAIAAFYETDDPPIDALEAIIAIAKRGLAPKLPRAS